MKRNGPLFMHHPVDHSMSCPIPYSCDVCYALYFFSAVVFGATCFFVIMSVCQQHCKKQLQPSSQHFRNRSATVSGPYR